MSSQLKYALTVWQPWAALIVEGPKDVENRRKHPPRFLLGQTIAIHAGKTFDDAAEAFARSIWPRGGHYPRLSTLEARGAIVGVATIADVCPPGQSCGDWHVPEQFGLMLANRRALQTPVPCRGMPGYWLMPDDIRAVIEAAAQPQNAQQDSSTAKRIDSTAP